MNTANAEPPTKKAFNFPKSADAKPAKAPAKSASEGRKKAAAPASSAAKKSVSKKSPAKTAGAAPKSKSKAPSTATETTGSKQTADAAVTPKKASKPTATVTESKAKRVKKEKVVRDSFTMPKADYAKLASLKQKCSANGLRVKKSELLRAALAMLDAAPDKRIVAAVKALEAVKTGRPANA